MIREAQIFGRAMSSTEIRQHVGASWYLLEAGSGSGLAVRCAESVQGATGQILVGDRVETQWTKEEGGDDQWYPGVVTDVDSTAQTATILYDDGDTWTGPAEYIHKLGGIDLTNHDAVQEAMGSGLLTATKKASSGADCGTDDGDFFWCQQPGSSTDDYDYCGDNSKCPANSVWNNGVPCCYCGACLKDGGTGGERAVTQCVGFVDYAGDPHHPAIRGLDPETTVWSCYGCNCLDYADALPPPPTATARRKSIACASDDGRSCKAYSGSAYEELAVTAAKPYVATCGLTPWLSSDGSDPCAVLGCYEDDPWTTIERVTCGNPGAGSCPADNGLQVQSPSGSLNDCVEVATRADVTACKELCLAHSECDGFSFVWDGTGPLHPGWPATPKQCCFRKDTTCGISAGPTDNYSACYAVPRSAPWPSRTGSTASGSRAASQSGEDRLTSPSSEDRVPLGVFAAVAGAAVLGTALVCMRRPRSRPGRATQKAQRAERGEASMWSEPETEWPDDPERSEGSYAAPRRRSTYKVSA